jgi:hypothetical protein
MGFIISSSCSNIFSLALLLRVLWQKRKLNQRVQWIKYRKLTIQSLSISTLYVLFNGPWTLTIFAYQYGLSDDIAMIAMAYTIYFYYYVIFPSPFVCLGSLPELRLKIKQKLLYCVRRRRQISPMISPTRRT